MFCPSERTEVLICSIKLLLTTSYSCSDTPIPFNFFFNYYGISGKVESLTFNLSPNRIFSTMVGFNNVFSGEYSSITITESNSILATYYLNIGKCKVTGFNIIEGSFIGSYFISSKNEQKYNIGDSNSSITLGFVAKFSNEFCLDNPKQVSIKIKSKSECLSAIFSETIDVKKNNYTFIPITIKSSNCDTTNEKEIEVELTYLDFSTTKKLTFITNSCSYSPIEVNENSSNRRMSFPESVLNESFSILNNKNIEYLHSNLMISPRRNRKRSFDGTFTKGIKSFKKYSFILIEKDNKSSEDDYIQEITDPQNLQNLQNPRVSYNIGNPNPFTMAVGHGSVNPINKGIHQRPMKMVIPPSTSPYNMAQISPYNMPQMSPYNMPLQGSPSSVGPYRYSGPVSEISNIPLNRSYKQKNKMPERDYINQDYDDLEIYDAEYHDMYRFSRQSQASKNYASSSKKP